MGVTTQRIFRARVEAKLDVLEEDAAELAQHAKERNASTTFGSPIFKDFVPDQDELIVERFLRS